MLPEHKPLRLFSSFAMLICIWIGVAWWQFRAINHLSAAARLPGYVPSTLLLDSNNEVLWFRMEWHGASVTSATRLLRGSYSSGIITLGSGLVSGDLSCDLLSNVATNINTTIVEIGFPFNVIRIVSKAQTFTVPYISVFPISYISFRWFSAATTIMLLMVIASAILHGQAQIIRWWRDRSKLCIDCGYPQGAPGVCSECGRGLAAVVDQAQPVDR